MNNKVIDEPLLPKDEKFGSSRELSVGYS